MGSLTVGEDGRETSVWAWGDNSRGKLGYWPSKEADYQLTPVQINALNGVSAVFAGAETVFGVRAGGTLIDPLEAGWDFGGFTNVVDVAFGWGDAYVAAKRDGTVWAWGDDIEGRLGIGGAGDDFVRTPTQVAGLTNVVAVAAVSGGSEYLALRTNGTVWGWGVSTLGFFQGLPGARLYRPTQVQELFNVTAIAAASNSAYALVDDGTVWAWGKNEYGQLGNGKRTDLYSRDGSRGGNGCPAPVVGLEGIVEIAGGYRSAYALDADGNVWAWGENTSGELGDGTKIDRLLPVQIPSLAGVVAIAASRSAYALKGDGRVWAWGSNWHGSLGDGTQEDSAVPVLVKDVSGVSSLACSYAAAFALEGEDD